MRETERQRKRRGERECNRKREDGIEDVGCDECMTMR